MDQGFTGPIHVSRANKALILILIFKMIMMVPLVLEMAPYETEAGVVIVAEVLPPPPCILLLTSMNLMVEMVITDVVVMDAEVTDVVVMAEVAEVAEALQLVVTREGTVDFHHTHPKW